jgi:RNA polymerase sigma-70 factor (ECF subfamily)
MWTIGLAERKPGRGDSPSAQAADGALVERALAGDDAAYDELVRRHYSRVYATAFRLVRSPEDAEDLAQECFVRAHASLAWFRRDAPMSAWLRRIVVHLARDRFRASARRPGRVELPLEPPQPDHAGPEAIVGARELARAVDEALRRLPPHLRTALVLRTLEGLEYDEVAEATGVTPATARTQVMKARRALARLMKPFLGRSSS